MTAGHMAAAAQEFALLGWPVMVIRPQAKEPLTRHGVKDATTDKQKILRWFKRWPMANLAIATGYPGPDVLDIDNPDLAGDLLGKLRSQHPPTVAAVRGPHLYYAGSERGTISLGFGELRSRGSYILVPPSIHPSGKEYVWIDRPDGPLPPFPTVLLPHQGTAGTGEFDAQELIPFGQRHDALKDAAVRFLRGGFTDAETIEAMLKSFFAAKCDPNPAPKPDEFRKIAHWAAKSDMAARERNSKPLLDPDPGKEKSSKKKKSALEKPPGGDAPLAEHRAYVQLAAGLPKAVEVSHVRRYGTRGADAIEIHLTNGQRIIFDRQDQVTTRGHWARNVVMSTNGIADPISITDWEQVRVMRSLCILADTPPEELEAERLQDAMNDLLALTELVPSHDFDTPEGRYDATADCHTRGSWDARERNPDKHPVLLVAKDGTRYLRAGEVRDYLNYRGFGISSGALTGRLHMIGVTPVTINGREHASPGREGRRTNHMRLYRLP